jgi:long-chain acyl-CoA synthetase
MINLTEKTLAQVCLNASLKYKNRTALAMFSNGEIIRQVTYEFLGIRSRQIGNLLRQVGVENGNRVLLLSENCPEWAFAYFGIAFAGAVSVPLLTGFSAEQIQNIAIHSGISAVCLNRAAAEKLDLENTFLFTQIPFIYIDSITSLSEDKNNNDNDINAEITVSTNGIEKQMLLCFQEQDKIDVPQHTPNDLATIIYTSGTQGNSKGVMLSGLNIITSSLASVILVSLSFRDRMLSVLPLAHSYECSLGLLAPIIAGASVTYLDRPPSPSVLLPAVKSVRPTVMVTVPLLIEKIYRNVIAPKLNNNKLYKFKFTRPLAIWAAGRKLISALGGKIRVFGIGGAPLSKEVEKFLRRARFPYSIGYGLTEAAPLIAGTTPNSFPLHSTGTAVNDVIIRVASLNEDYSNIHDSNHELNGLNRTKGEIQVRGPNVMMGYFNDEEKTSEAFTSDGWLRTGDLGEFDNKGKLHVKGRLKALILGPSGENIYPEEIENLLGSSQLVEDALVYSGEKGELIALVRLSDAAKAAAGAIEHAMEDLRTWVNKKLAEFSRLSRIEIKCEPFEKTPTMKIKRYLYL